MFLDDDIENQEIFNVASQQAQLRVTHSYEQKRNGL